MIKNGYVYEETEYKVFAKCCVCGEEILADGSTYYEFYGDVVCRCCVDDYVDNNFQRTTEME